MPAILHVCTWCAYMYVSQLQFFFLSMIFRKWNLTFLYLCLHTVQLHGLKIYVNIHLSNHLECINARQMHRWMQCNYIWSLFLSFSRCCNVQYKIVDIKRNMHKIHSNNFIHFNPYDENGDGWRGGEGDNDPKLLYRFTINFQYAKTRLFDQCAFLYFNQSQV